LERAFHPAKGANDLLHDTKSDNAGDQGRPEGSVRPRASRSRGSSTGSAFLGFLRDGG
jgi:hypothetical protein